MYLNIALFFWSVPSWAQLDHQSEFKPVVFDTLMHTRIYRIQIDNYQSLELIEFENGEFDGQLTNMILKVERNKTRSRLLIQRIKIPSSIAKRLIIKLKEKDFENIPDCKEISNCISGFDGTTISFSIDKRDFKREYSYWEPESDHYYKDNLIPEIVKVREILNTINGEFDLWKAFTDFRNRLPSGKYTYGTIVMVVK